MYLICPQLQIYHSGTLFLRISAWYSSHLVLFLEGEPLLTNSIISKAFAALIPNVIKSTIISSRHPMISSKDTFGNSVSPAIKSRALLNQTSVPCDKPDIFTRPANVFGLVCSNIPL